MDTERIDVLRDFSAGLFFSVYFAGRPAVISGQISHWPASRDWNPTYLMHRYGDLSVAVARYDPQGHSTFLDQTLADVHRTMSLRDFLSGIESGDGRYAVRENTALLQQMSPLIDELNGFSPFCSNAVPVDSRYKSLWLGPPHYVTGLHVDPGHTLLFQIYGRKQVLLFGPDETHFLYEEDPEQRRRKFANASLRSRLKSSEFSALKDQVRWSRVQPFDPDLNRFPRFSRACCIEAHIGPGDTLYIPDQWWHAVRALDVAISVSIEPDFEGPLFTGDPTRAA